MNVISLAALNWSRGRFGSVCAVEIARARRAGPGSTRARTSDAGHRVHRRTRRRLCRVRRRFRRLRGGRFFVQIMYAAAAVLCAIAGILSAWRAGGRAGRPCGSCVPHRRRGNAFALGAACTLIGSPCCGPLAAAISAGAIAYDPRDAIVLLASYAAGHVSRWSPRSLQAKKRRL